MKPINDPYRSSLLPPRPQGLDELARTGQTADPYVSQLIRAGNQAGGYKLSLAEEERLKRAARLGGRSPREAAGMTMI